MHQSFSSSCRIFLQVTGTVYIAHANFVGWVVRIRMKGLIMMASLHLHYLCAVCVRKNVLALSSSIFIICRFLCLSDVHTYIFQKKKKKMFIPIIITYVENINNFCLL